MFDFSSRVGSSHVHNVQLSSDVNNTDVSTASVEHLVKIKFKKRKITIETSISPTGSSRLSCEVTPCCNLVDINIYICMKKSKKLSK